MKKLNIIILICICIVEYKSQIIYTYAGNGTPGYSGNGGVASLAQIHLPVGIIVDTINHNVYFTDWFNDVIRKVNSTGVITTIAGNGSAGFSGDGGSAVLAKLDGPSGIVLDVTGNIYFSDENNNRIRKINTSGIITTIAGTGLNGYSGDGGPATLAELNNPWGLAIDVAGNLYIADQTNNCIRKINTSGIITTIAGNGTSGFSGDGGLATLAEINQASSVAVDITGNIYISEMLDHRIRKINTAGIINTIAGNGIAGFSGDGGPAISSQLNYPVNLHFDNTGNMYINDYFNYRVRKINTSNIITTITGNGITGYSGDNGLATNAQMAGSWATAADESGNLYICDSKNDRIRKICSSNCVTKINSLQNIDNSVRIFPNPSNGIFNIDVNIQSENLELVLINTLGVIVYQKNINHGINSILTPNLSKGIYNYIIQQDKLQISCGKISME